MKKIDVAIIGGGVIGLSIALELAAEKVSVVVLDRQQPGQEASWAAAGMLSPAPDSRKDEPLVLLGRESLALYLDFVTSIEDASEKSVGYVHEGTLEIFFSGDAESERDSRVSTCRRFGIAAEPISLDTARQWEKALGPNARAAAWLPEEGTVEPRSLMDALLEAAQRRRVEVRRDCRVTAIRCEGDRCTGVMAGGEAIASRYVVVAAGCFSHELAETNRMLARYVPTRPVRGQMVALRPRGARLQRVIRSRRGYLVPRKDGRVVAGSTTEEAGFERSVTPEGTRQILAGAYDLSPEIAGAELLETWAGLRPGTPDDLPILGPTDVDGLLIATGHYRNGILLAPVTAKLIREWIVQGRSTFDAKAFSPLRFRSGEVRTQKTECGNAIELDRLA